MLKSSLSFEPTVVRRGVALTRFSAAGRRSRTGWRALIDERTDLLLDGVERVLGQAAERVVDRLQLAGERPQAADRRAEHRRKLVGLGERDPGRPQGRSEQSDRALDVRRLAGDRAERLIGRRDELLDALAVLADAAPEDVHVVDQGGEVRLALRDLGVEASEPPVDRAEAAEQLAEVLAAAVQALATLGQQQAQVRPGVAIEGGEDLVDVRVRRRIGDRNLVAVLVLVVVRVGVVVGARIELEEHVLQAGLRTEQDRRVLVDGEELAVDGHRHDRVTVLVVDGVDVADADARHPDGLSLAWGDRLGGGHVGLQLERLLLEQRDPQSLVLDDDVGREQPDGEQAEDRQEVAQWSRIALRIRAVAPFGGGGLEGLMPFARWNAVQSLLQPAELLRRGVDQLLRRVRPGPRP